MRIAIVKALIRWLVRKHYRLVFEAIVGDAYHIHMNPRKKAKIMTMEQLRDEQDMAERRDEVDICQST